MVTPSTYHALTLFAEWYIALCLLCCLMIVVDQRRQPPPPMRIMLWVWPITALWAGPIALWLYRGIGRPRAAGHVLSGHGMPGAGATLSDRAGESVVMGTPAQKAAMPGMRDEDGMPGRLSLPEAHRNHEMRGGPSMPGMPGMGAMEGMGAASPTWRNVTTGTLHCGAGCTLADLVGPWIFRLMPFMLFGRLMYGEWLVDYVLALVAGVFFQYAAQAEMSAQRGPALWWRSFKVDFLSLTAWQIGMYGWMAIAMFWLIGPMSPSQPVFWLMMQIGMLCGFLTAFPMNWWLIREGIKSAM